MERKIKGFVFDIDGTLLDSMGIWKTVCSDYLRSIGIEPEDGLDGVVSVMTLHEGCVYSKEHYGLTQSVEEIEKGIIGIIGKFYYKEVQLKDGADDFVTKLHNLNIPMVLATTGHEDLAMHALDRLGIYDYFDRLLTCNALNTNKNKPDIFLEAKRLMDSRLMGGSSVSEICVVEDSLHALKTAKEAGFFVIGIKGESGEEELKQYADVVVGRLDEIIISKGEDGVIIEY